MTPSELRRSLTTVYARSITRPFTRAVNEFSLVKPGDKVAVCVSGGRDSMLLALLMEGLKRNVDYEPCFLAMDPGYTRKGRQTLENNAAFFGIPLEIFETDVLKIAARHSVDHPCFLCSKMRRGYLYSEAKKRGCSKIALGHHYDDAVETVLMGVLYGGQLQAMLPRLSADNYPGMELIRPLYLTKSEAIKEWSESSGLDFDICKCPVEKTPKVMRRAQVRELIARLSEENPQVKANILNAVKNVNTAKLLGWSDKNGRHSFLDRE